MRIPPIARPQIRRTWESEPPSIYGRFDLRYDGEGPPKLLEFNADTPTGLVESAVTQWNWHLFTGQGTDQWNALHDTLVAAWQRNLLKWERRTGVRPRVHLAWTSEETSGEDRMTVAYLMDTVVQAGYEAIELIVEDIVLDDGDGRFYDQQGRHLDVVFKLYPWEWLIEDEFGPAVLADGMRPGGTTWVEPAYKMLWSTKALLPVLWQLFGSDPVLGQYLLPAYFADEMPSSLAGLRAQAAVGPRGRQRRDRPGRRGGRRAARAGTAPRGSSSRSSPRCRTSPGVDGPHHPVLGAWVVDGEPAGMGIRESDGLITDNLSYFVPHTVDFAASPRRAAAGVLGSTHAARGGVRTESAAVGPRPGGALRAHRRPRGQHPARHRAAGGHLQHPRGEERQGAQAAAHEGGERRRLPDGRVPGRRAHRPRLGGQPPGGARTR